MKRKWTRWGVGLALAVLAAPGLDETMQKTASARGRQAVAVERPAAQTGPAAAPVVQRERGGPLPLYS